MPLRVLVACLLALQLVSAAIPVSGLAGADHGTVVNIVVVEAVGVADFRGTGLPARPAGEAAAALSAPPSVPVPASTGRSALATEQPETQAEPQPVAERLAVADSSSVLPSVPVTVNEAVSVSDLPRALLPAPVTVNEAVGVSDLPRALPPAPVTVNEAVGVSDLPRALSTVPVVVNEAISVTDLPGAQVVTPAALLGDANGDGRVDGADLALVLASFNRRRGGPGFDPNADLNGDGMVDVHDLVAVGLNFGRTR